MERLVEPALTLPPSLTLTITLTGHLQLGEARFFFADGYDIEYAHDHRANVDGKPTRQVVLRDLSRVCDPAGGRVRVRDRVGVRDRVRVRVKIRVGVRVRLRVSEN